MWPSSSTPCGHSAADRDARDARSRSVAHDFSVVTRQGLRQIAEPTLAARVDDDRENHVPGGSHQLKEGL